MLSKPVLYLSLVSGAVLLVLAAITSCGSSASRTFSSVNVQLGAPQSPPPYSAKVDFNAMQREQYSHLVENAFQSPATAPLSTFSVDVNTASYANVRRFLNEGKTPPADAVLLAELVNYFPYAYAQPKAGEAASLNVDLMPCPWQPKHYLARIGVKARDLEKSSLPRNLVFLIDVSGSMQQANRLPLVKKSLNLLVDTLGPRDTVAIVTYAGDTSVKLPPTGGGMKARIRSVIDGLGAGGGTNGSAGINLAYDQARAGFIAGGVNRVILCTDGDFNVGITSESELVRLIETQRNGDVYLSVLGYGMGNYNDATLKKLANHGNGFHAYIDSESEAHKLFVEQGAALAVVAKDVKLQVEFNPRKVNAYRLLGYENRMLKAEDFKDDAKDAGEMGAGHTVTALYEIVPAGVNIELPGVDPLKYQSTTEPAGPDGEWLTVKMRYKNPDSNEVRELAQPLSGKVEENPPADVRFAAAVAEFALLLRNSPYKGTANFDRVIEAAEKTVGPDAGGHRAEFVGLARIARRLEKVAKEEPISGDRPQ